MYKLFFKKQCHSHALIYFFDERFLKNGVEEVEGIVECWNKVLILCL